jgi:hypothetical protein
VIDAGLVPRLHYLLLHAPNETVLKETCLILSNVTAGPPSQIESVLSQDGLVERLILILAGGNEEIGIFSDKVRREVCWALGNAVLGRIYGQVKKCVDLGMVPALLDLVLQSYM